MGRGLWPLSEGSRKKIAERVTSNLSKLSFFTEKGQQVDDNSASSLAEKIEKDAFEATNQEADSNPDLRGSELVMNYARRCGDLMLSALRPGEKKEEVTREVAEEGVEKVFDISGGQRVPVKSAEEAEELLAALLVPNSGYTTIRLSSKAYTPDAAAVVAKAIGNARATLTHLDLSDTIASLPKEVALESLKIMTSTIEGAQLDTLNLSHNALGEAGLRAASVSITSQPGLKHLYLSNIGGSVEAAQAVNELLPSPEALETFHFVHNMAGDKGAEVVAEIVRKAPRLSYFRFASTRAGPDGCMALVNAIAEGTSLERLDLSDNTLTEEGGKALAQALSNHKGLKEVILADTGMEEDGAVALVEALASNGQQVEALDLEGNDLTADSIPRLAAALQTLPSLKRLGLACNELGNKGVTELCTALADRCINLEELDLSTTEITRTGAQAAAELAKNLLPGGFKLLKLNGNSISKEGQLAVAEALGIEVDDVDELSEGKGVLGPLDENDDEGGEEEE